jgi:hypothetical protein
MKLKYSPCKHPTLNTTIVVKNDSTLTIDGEDHEFDETAVTFPTICTDSGGLILEAHRENGELYVTVRRFYTGSCSAWDDGQYHDIAIGETA